MKSFKISRSLALRVLLSLILVGFLLTKVDVQKVPELLASTKLHFFLFALALAVVERMIFAFKWNMLLATKGLNIPFLRILKIYYVSNFIGTFLPSSIGVDVFRAYSLNKQNANPAESISSVLVDKVLSSIAALILPLAGVLLYFNVLAEQDILVVIVATIAAFGVLLGIVVNRALIQKLLDRIKNVNHALVGRIQDVYDAFSGYLAYKRVLIYVFGLSFGIQVIRALLMYLVGTSLDLDISIVIYFTFVPIITLLTMLPIAVGGIGIREGAYVYFFSQAGVPTSDAFALSLLTYVLVMISIIPGGIAYLLEGMSAKRGLAPVNDSRRRQSG